MKGSIPLPLSALGALVVLLAPARAWAQACCAGTGAVTPGRLALHEDALAGVQLRGASVLGSFDNGGRYASSPPSTSEIDLEEDLFGSLRITKRAQVALLVPVVETRRQGRGAGGTLSEFGGGIGDVNASARYDFMDAGQYRVMPGIAALVGVTFPSGTPVESATKPLATDATGVGAFQGNVGLALEQAYGAWLVNVTGIVAARGTRTVSTGGATIDETLGTQFTGLGALAYTFSNGAAAAFVASYALEGNATINGADAQGTARHLTQVSLSGMWPFSDHVRLQGSGFLDPPIGGLGRNLPALGGLTLTAVYSWS